MEPLRSDYYLSIAAEITSQAARVRSLIGDKHWGKDGSHKEHLLRQLLVRHCSSNVLVTSGFVVSPFHEKFCSTEQDILVIDTSVEAPFFSEGGTSIVFPNSVIAAISVKSTLKQATVSSVIKGLRTVRNVARNCNVNISRIWCGGYFYTLDESFKNEPTKTYQTISKLINSNRCLAPIIRSNVDVPIGPDFFGEANSYAFACAYENIDRDIEQTNIKIRGYDCAGAATAVFLAHLLSHINRYYTKGESLFADSLSNMQFDPLEPSTFDSSASNY